MPPKKKIPTKTTTETQQPEEKQPVQ